MGIAGTKLNFLAGDHHGTSSLAIDATTLAVTKRYSTPFGAPRGTKPTAWPDDKAFLGKPADNTTGLTHIGAREYDPGIGQFISVDPVLALDQHQSLNGYSYANNTPVTSSDATGLWCDSCNDGAGWTRPDGGTAGDPDGGKNDDGTPRGTGGGGGGGGGSQGTAPTSSAGFTVPTEDELRAMPYAWPGDSYDQLVQRWAKDKCFAAGGGTGQTAGLCTSAKSAGLLEVGNDPWGVQANINCVRGKGDCVEAVVSDFIALFGWGIGRLLSGPVGKGAAGTVSASGAKGSADGALSRLLGACTKCFLAGTGVKMADGSSKNIEDIKVGEKVLATDPETGETGPREVTQLIVTEHDKHFNELTIETDVGLENLTATHEHPFWSPSERQWIEAGELKPGMTLLTDDGTTLTVQANRPFSKHARTYNLTVDDLHTYYVLAGQTPVLVHNSGGCLPALRDWSSQRFQFGNQSLLLDKKGMEHILTRHHPKYWDGSVKKTQSFFDSSMSVDDVQGAIGQVMRQNRDTLVQRGSQGMYQIRGNVNGVDYVLGMNKGRVGQFYPE
ncbi:polymorphic toxin-type HINT domain-containing protein [Streptomyces sp. V1I1]|uniref:polymorphic toxin-type HINT domain-containing protein n=1 Tax=Streptomyces sp. V1I1 TaxID=3042272 RepID=UPI00278333D3|nr:polymorphic toxin-type HINT domain-containing protein [Streptomyces sp. V1I1]MDQ0943493.1 RHS repeat-associated protein [Streptomyces sp. V1I1]